MTKIPPRRVIGLHRLLLPFIAIVLFTSLWLSKRLQAACPSLQTNGSLVFQSVSDTADEWSVLEQSVLRLWQTSPETNARRPSKPRIITHLVKGDTTTNHSVEDIVLATHVSGHKFDVLLIQLDRWAGPASVAVYLTSAQEISTFFSFVARYRQERLRQTTFHVALEQRASSSPSSSTEDEKPLYPHNILRNVALETIESDYFVALDVDFIPSPNAHDQLMHYLHQPPSDHGEMEESRFRQELRSKRMFVLPAFELFPREGEQYATADMLPDNKRQLIDMVQSEKLVPFRKSAPVGHSLTDFNRWLGMPPSSETNNNNNSSSLFYYELPFKGTKRREVWEPYVVGYRPGIPRYWEDFRGYGFDKYSFFIECQLAGYTFAVLHDLFCTHLDHPEVSKDDQAWLLERNEVYYAQFHIYLREKYGKHHWLVPTMQGDHGHP